MQVLSSSSLSSKTFNRASYPRPVTRGESREEGIKTIVDWLTATFKKPVFSASFLIGMLSDYMGCSVRGVDNGKGLRGFETCIQLQACVNDDYKQIGFIAFGGGAQNGRWMLDLSGAGCGMVQDWEALQDLLENLEEIRLTRVDLAADFLEGQKTVDDAVEMFKAGEFTMNGRPPQTDTTGDWLTGERGRTLYVGKRKNGKQLCIYEKGKQLGDLNSKWTRYELRLGNRDREIPLDILTETDKYFAGAYPALQDILSHVEGERIDTISREAHISLVHLLYHQKRCYGKLFSTLKGVEGYNVKDLVESLTVSGIPNRLDPASINAGLNWETLKRDIEAVHG